MPGTVLGCTVEKHTALPALPKPAGMSREGGQKRVCQDKGNAKGQ